MFRAFALALLSTLTVSTSHAISENNYSAVYESEVLPYYTSAGRSATLKGTGDITLHYVVIPAQTGANRESKALVILPGKGEPSRKYAELAYDLRNEGFTIYLLDHRGQGFSQRLTQDPEVEYVRDFQEYVSDLTTFMNTVVLPTNPSKTYLYGHSMGGAIGAWYMAEKPGTFAAAVFTGPMLQVNTDPYPESVAYFISDIACDLGHGKRYAFGQGPYSHVKFDENKNTRSAARYEVNEKFLLEHPEARVGGVSFRWVQQSLRATYWVRENASRVSTPTLILQAGQDKLVIPEGQREYCEKAANCRLLPLPEASHDIMVDRDAVRDQAIREMLDFFRAH